MHIFLQLKAIVVIYHFTDQPPAYNLNHKMNHELMCKLNMHDSQVIELMGTHDFTQLQQQQQQQSQQQEQQQQQQQQMLNYAMTETQNISSTAQQHNENTNQDNNRTSRPIRRTSRRTPQVSAIIISLNYSMFV